MHDNCFLNMEGKAEDIERDVLTGNTIFTLVHRTENRPGESILNETRVVVRCFMRAQYCSKMSIEQAKNLVEGAKVWINGELRNREPNKLESTGVYILVRALREIRGEWPYDYDDGDKDPSFEEEREHESEDV